MPVRYRDQDEIDELGTAGYLWVEPDVTRSWIQGAFFQVNVRGEPVEFTYSRVTLPDPFLWRQEDIQRAASRKLVTSLFTSAQATPRLLCCLASQIDAALFKDELSVTPPVCLFPSTSALDRDEGTGGIWIPSTPAPASPEGRLWQRLTARGLISEPFQRVAAGVREVFGDPATNP